MALLLMQGGHGRCGSLVVLLQNLLGVLRRDKLVRHLASVLDSLDEANTTIQF